MFQALTREKCLDEKISLWRRKQGRRQLPTLSRRMLRRRSVSPRFSRDRISECDMDCLALTASFEWRNLHSSVNTSSVNESCKQCSVNMSSVSGQHCGMRLCNLWSVLFLLLLFRQQQLRLSVRPSICVRAHPSVRPPAISHPCSWPNKFTHWRFIRDRLSLITCTVSVTLTAITYAIWGTAHHPSACNLKQGHQKNQAN